jgi:hypothetical protein
MEHRWRGSTERGECVIGEAGTGNQWRKAYASIGLKMIVNGQSDVA